MAIWKREVTLQQLNQRSQGTLVAHLGIVFTAMDDQTLTATLPVDQRTRQPFGLLHGGASAVLAETLGSMAGYLCTEGDDAIVGWKSTRITCARCGKARSGEFAARCIWDGVIRSGRLISMTRSSACAAPPG